MLAATGAITAWKRKPFSAPRTPGARGPQFRRDCLRLSVGRVEVGEAEIRTSGSKFALAKAVAAELPQPAALVPSFVREWRRSGAAPFPE
jgi:hypothetical protein